MGLLKKNKNLFQSILNIISKNYFYFIIYFIISFICFFSIWAISIFENIRNANIVEPVIIEINSKNINDLDLIEIFRLAPKSGTIKIEKNENNLWISKNGYFTKILISIPNNNILKNIVQINISIGKNKFEFDNNNFLKEWQIVKSVNNTNKNYISFESPLYLKAKKSSINYLSNIINWSGDSKVILFSLQDVIPYWLTIFISCFLLLILIGKDNIKFSLSFSYNNKKKYYKKTIKFKPFIIKIITFLFIIYLYLPKKSYPLIYLFFIFIILIYILYYKNILFKENKIKEFKFNLFEINNSSIILLFILFFGFILRVYKSNWGFPLLLHPDETFLVKYPVKMILENTLDPLHYNRPNHISIYIHSIFYDFLSYLIFQKPLIYTYDKYILFYHQVSRILVAFIGTISIYIAYLIGKEYHKIFGFFAALLFTLFPLFIIHSHYITPDVPLTLFLILVILFSIKYLKHPSNKNLILACFFSALATAEKYPGLFSLILIGFIILINNYKDIKILSMKLFFSGLLFTIFLFITAPFLFISISEVVNSIIYESKQFHLGADGLGFLGNLLFYFKTYIKYNHFILTLFFITGFSALIFQFKKQFIPIFYGFLFWIIISKLYLHWERWGIPIYITPLFITAYGIYFIYNIIKNTNKKMNLLLVTIFILLLTVCFIDNFLINLNQLIIFSSKDTRLESTLYVNNNDIQENSSLFEGYTPFSPGHPKSFFKEYENLKNNNILNTKKYIILSSYMYLRYFNEKERYKEAVTIYKEIFNYPLLIEFQPIIDDNYFFNFFEFNNILNISEFYQSLKKGLLTGPIIKIYKINL